MAESNIEGLSVADRECLRLGQEIMKNSETRFEGLKLAKRANPALRVPEVEQAAAVEAAEKRALDREEKLAQQLREERVLRRQREEHDRIREQGFEPAAIEKIVVDEKCSIDTALKLARQEREIAATSAPDVRTGPGGNLPGTPIDFMNRGEKKDDWRKLTPEQARGRAADIANDMVQEFRTRRRA